ncbi:helix-hairpin-helix domain-containing protein [Streptococcus dysgalactiae subsp. equisimilis]|uniref:helix-hairpin-helix domain-containing protein n=1 Tax=Streptococcus dysgalactiae TaxID=1334 RepID=UPI003FD83CDA
MAKQKNRKKALKLEMKRNGLLKKAGQVFDKAVESVGTAVDKTMTVSKDLVEKGSQTISNLTTSHESLSLDEFSALAVVEGIRSDLVETLYAEGIHSAQAFKEWTEKDLLALKGIGPATVKKLVENGASLKK